MKSSLGSDFKRCVEFRDANSELLGAYNDDFDFMELGKMAIDYSDGVIEADQNVNSDLLNYASSKGTPILSYCGDNFGEAYQEFYEKIIG